MRSMALIALVMLMAPQGPVHAQELDPEFVDRGPRFLLASNAEPVRLDVTRTPLLQNRIALDLRNVPAHEALAAITRASGLRLFYSEQMLERAGRVTLRAEEITVAAALSAVLLDAGIDVLFSRTGNAALVRRGSNAIATGTLTGRVTDSTSQDGVAGVTISVEGSRVATTSAQDGRYTLAAAPAGDVRINARRLGYLSRTRAVNIPEGGSATLDFVLVRTPTVLREVVVTPTGERQRLEVGNSIGTIKADSVVRTSLIRNLSDLLQARVAGVVVSNTSGMVGAPSKVRVRGVNSIALNNDPIVIVDGVRLVSQTTVATSQTNVGATAGIVPSNFTSRLAKRELTPSRLDDIDPSTIESIDLLRGPSASSLYGTEAANGVIVIKTKQGSAGAWRMNFTGDQGWSNLPGRMPDVWTGWGTMFNGATNTSCSLSAWTNGGTSVEDGTCRLDSVTHFHPLNHSRMRTLGTGGNRSVTANLSGGTERLRQFISVRAADNVGMAKMSEFERDRLSRTWTSPPPSWMVRPNTETQINASSRTNVQMGPRFDFSVTSGLTYRDVLNGGAAIPIYNTDVVAGARTPSDTLRYLPSESQRAKRSTTAKRGQVAASANYTPLSWLRLRGTLGGDYTLRTDDALLQASDCTPFLAATDASVFGCRSGRGQNREELFATTVDVGAQFSYTPLPWLTSRTSLGEQVNHVRFQGLRAGNTGETNLAFGTDLLSPAPVPTTGTPQLYEVAESRDEGATAGWYIEQTLSFRERLFVTGAIRRDAASAFGANVNASAPIYPKLSASWLLSDENLFPRQGWVPTLRLRAAYGQSGNQASRTSLLNNFQLDQAFVDGAFLPAVQLSRLGNPDLKPERTSEWEGGADISFLDRERIRAELTIYRKLSTDAITTISLPSSAGVGFYRPTSQGFVSRLSQAANLGSVENRGIEVSANARIVDSWRYSWELGVNWARNANKLVHRDPRLPASNPEQPQFRQGYPLYSYWGFPVLSYDDVNSDGVLQFSEMTLGDRVFMGAPYPDQQVTYTNSLSFAGGALRLNGIVDHTMGLANKRVFSSFISRCNVDASCSLAQQAAATQASINRGFIGETSNVRLAELSATFNLPGRVLRRMAFAQSLAVTVAGRNLGLWSNYVGKDPNVDTSGALGEAISDDGTGVPQPRMWTVRLNLGL